MHIILYFKSNSKQTRLSNMKQGLVRPLLKLYITEIRRLSLIFCLYLVLYFTTKKFCITQNAIILSNQVSSFCSESVLYTKQQFSG